MPTPRRRRPAQPNRRTTVAGLRKPGRKPSPRPRQDTDEEQTPTDSDATVEATGEPDADEAQNIRTGVEGQSEAAEAAGADADETDGADADDAEAAAAETAAVDATGAEAADAAGAEAADAAGADADGAEAAAAETAAVDAAGADADAAEAAEAAEADGAEADTGAGKPAPRPSPKPRDTGAAKPTTVQDNVDADDTPEAGATVVRPARSRVKRSPRTILTAIGAVLGVVFAALAGFFAWQFFGVKNTTDNRALSDATATSQVKEEINQSIERLLSYSYQEIDEHEQAVDEILVGDEVKSEFDKLYSDVQEKAPDQKLVLQTKVSYSSALEMTEDDAQLLMFVEQSAEREGTDQESTGGGMVKVTAKHTDGSWLISGLDTYGELQPTGDGEQGEQGSDEQQSPGGGQQESPEGGSGDNGNGQDAGDDGGNDDGAEDGEQGGN